MISAYIGVLNSTYIAYLRGTISIALKEGPWRIYHKLPLSRRFTKLAHELAEHPFPLAAGHTIILLLLDCRNMSRVGCYTCVIHTSSWSLSLVCLEIRNGQSRVQTLLWHAPTQGQGGVARLGVLRNAPRACSLCSRWPQAQPMLPSP